MLTHALAYLAGAATALAVAVALGARWRRKRRRVDALHAAMLQAVWDVQDTAAILIMAPPTSADFRRDEVNYWAELRQARSRTAARYFAAVGE